MAKNRIFDLSNSVANTTSARDGESSSKPRKSNVYLNQLYDASNQPEGELTKVKIDLIDVSGNPRKQFTQESIKGLARNIKSMGLLQPIVVRKKGKSFELVAGERRIRAAKLNGDIFIDAIVKNVDQIDPLFIPEYRLVENLQREDLKDIETALSLAEIRERNNYSISDLVAKFGKSESWVKQKLAHAAIIDKLISGKNVQSIETLSEIPTSIILSIKPQLEKNPNEALSWLLPQLKEGIIPKRAEFKEYAIKNKVSTNKEPQKFNTEIEKLEDRIIRAKEKIKTIENRIKVYHKQIKALQNNETATGYNKFLKKQKVE